MNRFIADRIQSTHVQLHVSTRYGHVSETYVIFRFSPRLIYPTLFPRLWVEIEITIGGIRGGAIVYNSLPSGFVHLALM